MNILKAKEQFDGNQISTAFIFQVSHIQTIEQFLNEISHTEIHWF
jgi:hypothetical protein